MGKKCENGEDLNIQEKSWLKKYIVALEQEERKELESITTKGKSPGNRPIAYKKIKGLGFETAGS